MNFNMTNPFQFASGQMMNYHRNLPRA
jgi:hypothetical protein